MRRAMGRHAARFDRRRVDPIDRDQLLLGDFLLCCCALDGLVSEGLYDGARRTREG